MITCCKDCKKRYTLCWCSCKEYIEQRTAYEEQKNKDREMYVGWSEERKHQYEKYKKRRTRTNRVN